MAEYCSLCFKEDVSTGYDYNLYKIANKLEKGYSTSFLCEGCSRRAIYRDEEGLYYIAIDNGKEFEWQDIELKDLKILKPINFRFFGNKFRRN